MILSAYLFADGLELAAPAIAAAAQAIRAGALVGLPTETVYGLGADADDATAVAQIFSTKGRPSNHPLIVHLAAFDGGMGGVAHFARQVPPFARQLMAAFWPGPLTLILHRKEGAAAASAGGQDSIGLRCPAHPVAQALLCALRNPQAGEPVVWGIAAPSANRFGRVSPTTAAHVHSEFGDALLIMDGGACGVGIESTIINCTRGVPVLLRPGSISSLEVEQACGQPLRTQVDMQSQALDAPRASGTLESHYAPAATVRLMDSAVLEQATAAMEQAPIPANGRRIGLYVRSFVPRHVSHGVLRRMPQAASAAAHELFAVLREFDDAGVSEIWVETPPGDPQWDGVRDRLQRAAVR